MLNPDIRKLRKAEALKGAADPLDSEDGSGARQNLDGRLWMPVRPVLFVQFPAARKNPPMLRQLAQGRIGRHPLHPLIVHLPIGLWATSLLLDIAFFAVQSPFLATISHYCIRLGLIGAVLAFVAGFIELSYLYDNPELKKIASLHLRLNVLVTALYVPNTLIRQFTGPEFVPGIAFALSCIGMVLLAVSGYLGGIMVYRFGMGRHPQSRIPDERVDEERAA